MKPVHGCYLFGVYRACVGIKDAVILFHSIAGCHIGTLMMHLNNDLENVHQGCSVVYEQDIVFGGQKQLGKALQNVKELYPEMKLLIVISGCIPNMIGDDVDAEIARAELNVPAIHIAAAGTDGSEQDGFKSALVRLTELIEPAQELQEGLINVWGLSEDDPRMTADLIALQKLVGSKIKLQYLGAACSLAELKAAAKAELNIIFGGHLELAQQLEERFGTPYIMADYPYGLSGMISLQQQITEHLPYLDYTEQQQAAVSCLRSELKKAAYYLNFMYGIPVAIIGDKARSAGMKHFLSEELGMKVVFFNDDCQADLADCCEKIKDSNAVLLFGSSFARGIANELGIPLIPLFYPVFDQIVLGYKPFIGVEGVLNIIEVIINSFMQQKHKPHGNFAQISKELECGRKQDEA